MLAGDADRKQMFGYPACVLRGNMFMGLHQDSLILRLAGPGGRRIDGDYQVTAFERPRLLEFQVTAGPARPVGVFELSGNTGQPTRVRFALNLNPAGLMKLMTPMITKRMRREVAQLDNLKAILERTS